MTWISETVLYIHQPFFSQFKPGQGTNHRYVFMKTKFPGGLILYWYPNIGVAIFMCKQHHQTHKIINTLWFSNLTPNIKLSYILKPLEPSQTSLWWNWYQKFRQMHFKIFLLSDTHSSRVFVTVFIPFLVWLWAWISRSNLEIFKSRCASYTGGNFHYTTGKLN